MALFCEAYCRLTNKWFALTLILKYFLPPRGIDINIVLSRYIECVVSIEKEYVEIAEVKEFKSKDIKLKNVYNMRYNLL